MPPWSPGPPTFDQIFTVRWCAAGVYLVSMYVLAFRLGWLKRTGRFPEAPTAFEFLFGGFGWTALSFLYGKRHRVIGDLLVSVITLSARVFILIYLILFCFLAFGVVR